MPQNRTQNRIEFQNGLSLGEFLRQYGGEARCREVLARWRCQRDSSVRSAVIPATAWWTEPPREFRRLGGVSHAAIADSVTC